MAFISEENYEKYLINSLEKLGYKYLDDRAAFNLRNQKLENVILESHLHDFLKKKYDISLEHWHQVIRKVEDLKTHYLEKGNLLFMQLLVQGVKVRDEKLQKTVSYYLIDFENHSNNTFAVTNQFTLVSNHPNQNHQRPDVVVYVNGLPLVVFELKSPELQDEDSLLKAWEQIQNYQKWIQDLFIYNAFNVISNWSISKFGTITSSYARYQFWRGKRFDSDANEGLINDLLKPKVLLDVIKNYIYAIDESKNNSFTKIIAAYHQYYGVKEAMKSLEKAMLTEKTRKGGIFWHTQGSGKSLSMLFLAKNLARKIVGTTFVVVTDRVDLDEQLFETFKKADAFLGMKVEKIESIADLQIKLKNLVQDGVYFTTVQKFTSQVKELSARENVVVITDEAHRSHNNLEGKVYFNDFEMYEKFGNAKYLREAFPNASFIGFTGTPIEKEDKSTSKIFGRILDSKYLMKDAERDGVVVPIEFESRMPKLHLEQEVLKELDKYVLEENALAEKTSLAPSEIRKKINRLSQKIENFIKNPERIKGIVADFVGHYESRENVVIGKAMFVAYDRHTALAIFNEVIRLRTTWKEKVKLVVTNANNQNDDPQLIELSGTTQYRNNLARQFKDDSSPFKIAIVVDMWLTGFDVPSLDTLYLDKPAKMHNLMQTIARTNRVYYDKKASITKECGVIVDYIGVWSRLKDALAFYSGMTSAEVEQQSDILALKKKYLKILELFYQNYVQETKLNFLALQNDASLRMTAVKDIFDEVLKSVTPEERRVEQFIIGAKALGSHFKSIVSVLTPLEKLKYNLVLAVRVYMIKVVVSGFDMISIESEIKQLLAKAISYQNTEVIDKIRGHAIRLSEILNFIQNHNEPRANLDAETKISATRQLIEELKNINIVKSKKLSESLKQLMQKYEAGYITLEELVDGIKDIAQDAAKTTEDEEGGYSATERAFYAILLEPVKGVFDEKNIRKIMEQLLVIVNNKNLVNATWKYNEKMVTNVKSELYKLLIKNGYPPEKVETSKEEIIQQIMYQMGNGSR